MNDSQNVTIAMLCVSATILAAVLGLMHASSPARADSQAAAGEYIMVTGAYAPGTDILYMVDLSSRTMNAYGYERTNNTIKLADQVNLQRAFAASK